MKIFLINESDFVVAKTKSEAKKCWMRTTGCSEWDIDDEIMQLAWEEAKNYKFMYDEVGKRTCTFEERINEVLSTGEEKIPFYLATNEF